jgi:hypothetical protein
MIIVAHCLLYLPLLKIFSRHYAHFKSNSMPIHHCSLFGWGVLYDFLGVHSDRRLVPKWLFLYSVWCHPSKILITCQRCQPLCPIVSYINGPYHFTKTSHIPTNRHPFFFSGYKGRVPTINHSNRPPTVSAVILTRPVLFSSYSAIESVVILTRLVLVVLFKATIHRNGTTMPRTRMSLHP